MSSRFRTIVVTLSTLLVALLLMGAVLDKNSSKDGAYPELGVYTEVLARIKSDYVEEPDLKNVTLGALNGLLESIDPFASYLNAEQYKEYLKNHDANKGGVGLVLSKRFGYVGVVDAIPGSPAARAGLATGDMVESIRGIATRDMPLAYANLLLQGKPGSSIELSILSMRHPEPKKITLSRVVVQFPKVAERMIGDQLGYVQVQSITTATINEVAAAVRNLEKQGAKKLLLDLRHCSTGTPEEGVALANLFLNKGLITYVQGQKVARENTEADPAKAITALPLVVMTNRGTAGGAEVAASALLENKRAELVGERTYGNASIRRTITMDDGGAIILSVAKYYSPGGKAIQDTGVTPTVQVAENEQPAEPDEETPEETAPPAPVSPSEDPVLKKAIEVATKGVVAQSQQKPADTTPRPPDTRDMPPLHVPNPPQNQ